MTAPAASPARTGVWIGIATITMSFAAYTSALVVRQGSGGDWQHVQLAGTDAEVAQRAVDGHVVQRRGEHADRL